ncbi:flagellin N-terminal helical domain-containing protein [Polymorphobacter sp.]|uniref:flagellin N-terminal helical domain-containing protein n=1 Tax=Polymorphobacter sp. TaxID=1909290 RepID=UPI003F6FBA85
MSLAPAPPVAINTRAAHGASVSRLTALSARVDQLQAQISTSKRVNTPADDPVAFTRAAVLRRAQAADAATARAIDAASARLRTTDITLGSINNLVQRAAELALAGSNATLNADDRAILAGEVAELAASFAGLAETRTADGDALFGGARSPGPAYAPDADGTLQWQGDGTPPAVLAGGALIPGGVTGPEAFGRTTPPTPENPLGTSDLFASFAGLEAALTEPDPTLRAEALARRLTEMQAHASQLADSQALVGARGARLESESDRLASQKLSASSELSRLEDLDMIEAVATLQRLLTVLEAAQASFVRTSSNSLWDQLR